MTSIFVAKLDFGITSEQVKQAFEAYGTVLKATVAVDKETGKSRGFAFVEMTDKEAAMNAIEALDGSTMNGRPIAVKEAEQRADNRPPRDGSRPRPEFNKSNDGSPSRPFKRDENRAPRNDDRDDSPKPFAPPATEVPKVEIRKKSDKKGKDFGDIDGRSKKPKMDAYKKSGKNNRFFDDDDDDDFDLNALHKYDDDDDFDDEEDN
jgi:RNA recognition motif-containing protein